MTSLPASARIGWRTPAIIIVCGCLMAIISFGPRSAAGLFLTPLSSANGWGRDVFAFAFALQNLLWGIAQPFAGAIADRFGTLRVIWVGATLYAIGLVMMAYATSPLMLDVAVGVFTGFGIAGCSFPLVIAAFGKLLPERYRVLSFGLGTAAGSFGQFLFSPLALALIDAFNWQIALIIFACLVLLVLPLAVALSTPPNLPGTGIGTAASQSLGEALAEALRNRSYVLLVIGYFTCGFQLQFITVHMPSYLIDRGLSATVGGWTLAIIGLFNIFGSVLAGYLGQFLPKRFILSVIYFLRAASVLAFISFPVTPVTALIFGASMGFLWLSTVPPTNGIIALIFGTRWLATLAGFAFFSHQLGGFFGVWLGGLVFERSGSYDAVWWLSILFGVLSAVINLPIVEKPVLRPAVQPA